MHVHLQVGHRDVHVLHGVPAGCPSRRLSRGAGEFEVTKKELAAAKDTLAEVEAKVAALNAKLDEANGKKKDLQDQSDRCEAQLERG